jgi:hypothetical protein
MGPLAATPAGVAAKGTALSATPKGSGKGPCGYEPHALTNCAIKLIFVYLFILRLLFIRLYHTFTQ